MNDDNEFLSYDPLFRTLKEKGIKISELRTDRKYELLHPKTVSTINANKTVSMSALISLCRFLKVPIDQVIRIDFD